jgi:hypothetical protein
MFSLLSNEFTSSDLLMKRWTKRRYKNDNDVPYYVRGVMNEVIRELKKKMKLNREPLTIEETFGRPRSIRLRPR